MTAVSNLPVTLTTDGMGYAAGVAANLVTFGFFDRSASVGDVAQTLIDNPGGVIDDMASRISGPPPSVVASAYFAQLFAPHPAMREWKAPPPPLAGLIVKKAEGKFGRGDIEELFRAVGHELARTHQAVEIASRRLALDPDSLDEGTRGALRMLDFLPPSLFGIERKQGGEWLRRIPNVDFGVAFLLGIHRLDPASEANVSEWRALVALVRRLDIMIEPLVELDRAAGAKLGAGEKAAADKTADAAKSPSGAVQLPSAAARRRFDNDWDIIREALGPASSVVGPIKDTLEAVAAGQISLQKGVEGLMGVRGQMEAAGKAPFAAAINFFSALVMLYEADMTALGLREQSPDMAITLATSAVAAAKGEGGELFHAHALSRCLREMETLWRREIAVPRHQRGPHLQLSGMMKNTAASLFWPERVRYIEAVEQVLNADACDRSNAGDEAAFAGYDAAYKTFLVMGKIEEAAAVLVHKAYHIGYVTREEEKARLLLEAARLLRGSREEAELRAAAAMAVGDYWAFVGALDGITDEPDAYRRGDFSAFSARLFGSDRKEQGHHAALERTRLAYRGSDERFLTDLAAAVYVSRTKDGNGVEIKFRMRPSSRRLGIVGAPTDEFLPGSALMIALEKPAIFGGAADELAVWVARVMGVDVKRVEIAPSMSDFNLVRVTVKGIDEKTAAAKLQAPLNEIARPTSPPIHK